MVRYEAFYSGSKFTEVIAESFIADETKPSRHFPAAATRVVYAGGREIRRDELRCENVEFLDPANTDLAIVDVDVPGGSQVFDTVLERTIDLTAPTSGIALLTDTA